MNEQMALLQKVNAYAFAAHEWNLYLDTHPSDKEGIKMFHKIAEQAEKYKTEYSEKFEPLTPHDATNPDFWNWIDEPWPWDTYSDGTTINLGR
ncbi:MAG: spore coat protein CotJB [Oscillospiraceae bacterium]